MRDAGCDILDPLQEGVIMQSTIKPAQDFVEGADGFASCLMQMNSAAHDGVQIDFSEWGDVAEPLMTLDAEPLETLMDAYRDFYIQKCKKGLRASKAAGIKLGRRRKALPENFDQAVEHWLSGKMSGTEAAKVCGMPLSSFYLKARTAPVVKRPLQDRTMDVCAKWAGGEITKAEAAAELGVSVNAFQKILKENKIRKKYIPDSFEKYCALWEAGTISKEEAAKLCKISLHRFEGCLSKTGRNQKEVV